MSQVLLIVLGLYLAACYAYGVYLLVRVAKVPTILRPTSRREATDLVREAKAELQEQVDHPGEQRIAA